MSITLGERLSGRDNALNTVRLLLAWLVIVSHSLAVTGRWEGGTGIGALDEFVRYAGDWAVAGFFIASGYLVTGSRLRCGLGAYLVRRACRIMPGFWTALVVVAFVLAPAVTWWAGGTYVPRSASGFVIRNSLLVMVQAGVANTLGELPTARLWLVPAWTLIYEFGCYVAVGLALTLTWVRRHILMGAGIALAVLMALLPAFNAGGSMSASPLQNALRLGSFFSAGCLFYAVRDIARVTIAGMLGAVAVLIALRIVLGVEHMGWWAQLPLGYLILGSAAVAPLRLGSVNDISYGLYLYGWPMQQVSQAVWPGDPLRNVLIATGLAVPAAMASWYLVERRALRLAARLTSAGRRAASPTNRPARAQARWWHLRRRTDSRQP